jgi:hypothetical protein
MQPTAAQVVVPGFGSNPLAEIAEIIAGGALHHIDLCHTERSDSAGEEFLDIIDGHFEKRSAYS